MGSKRSRPAPSRSLPSRQHYENSLRESLGFAPTGSANAPRGTVDEAAASKGGLAPFIKSIVRSCPIVPTANNGTVESIGEFMGLWSAWLSFLNSATASFDRVAHEASLRTVNAATHPCWHQIAVQAQHGYTRALRDVRYSFLPEPDHPDTPFIDTPPLVFDDVWAHMAKRFMEEARSTPTAQGRLKAKRMWAVSVKIVVASR